MFADSLSDSVWVKGREHCALVTHAGRESPPVGRLLQGMASLRMELFLILQVSALFLG